jgi:hypothetical protein
VRMSMALLAIPSITWMHPGLDSWVPVSGSQLADAGRGRQKYMPTVHGTHTVFSAVLAFGWLHCITPLVALTFLPLHVFLGCCLPWAAASFKTAKLNSLKVRQRFLPGCCLLGFGRAAARHRWGVVGPSRPLGYVPLADVAPKWRDAPCRSMRDFILSNRLKKR